MFAKHDKSNGQHTYVPSSGASFFLPLEDAYLHGTAAEFVAKVLELMAHPVFGPSVPKMAGAIMHSHRTIPVSPVCRDHMESHKRDYDGTEQSVRKVLGSLSSDGNTLEDWEMVNAAAAVWFFKDAFKSASFREDWDAAMKKK